LLGEFKEHFTKFIDVLSLREVVEESFKIFWVNFWVV